MKTYKKEIDSPKLEIYYDQDAESPREWDGNLGYFITVDRGVKSPDQENDIIKEIVRRTGEEAESGAEHIRMITGGIEQDTNEKVIAIFPIVKYEHSGVVYKLGKVFGFDYSNNGFYIITDKTQKDSGVKKKDFEKVIKAELDIYNNWINGEVYGFNLYDENGEEVDSLSGFFDIEDIKEDLPDEWKNEDLREYLIN